MCTWYTSRTGQNTNAGTASDVASRPLRCGVHSAATANPTATTQISGTRRGGLGLSPGAGSFAGVGRTSADLTRRAGLVVEDDAAIRRSPERGLRQRLRVAGHLPPLAPTRRARSGPAGNDGSASTPHSPLLMEGQQPGLATVLRAPRLSLKHV
ncbi:hypothetical protein GCM10020229_35150 [Kitasatospora albolonga]